MSCLCNQYLPRLPTMTHIQQSNDYRMPTLPICILNKFQCMKQDYPRLRIYCENLQQEKYFVVIGTIIHHWPIN